jgi:hypothetical protein
MSRASKTGRNRPGCLLLYSKFTTWYRSYKVTDLSLEASRNTSGYLVPTSRRTLNDTFMSEGDNTDNGLRRGEHVYQDRRVVDAFTRAGYTLESNDEDENGWAR